MTTEAELRGAARLGRLILKVRPAPLAAALKALLRVRRVEAETAEGRFWLDPASDLGLRLLTERCYEPELSAVLDRLLAPGGVFVDVGANEGYFSVAAARRVGPAGRVVAVEPQERLRPVLERNFALNGCGNVRLAAVAVSDRPGTTSLHLAPAVNNSASSLQQNTRYRLRRQPVRCATLEQVFAEQGVGSCELLKVDVEGWEYEVVLGSPGLFRDGRVRAVALELHAAFLAKRGRDGAEIERFLAGCGYRPLPDCPLLVLRRDS